MSFELVCFDLDGTLVDSHADIRDALEVALAALPPGDPARDAAAIGSAGLGFPLEEFFSLARPELTGQDGHFQRFREAYREHYHAHLLDRTKPFPGVVETLERVAPLRARGLRVAVATTKRTDTAKRVCAGLGLDRFLDGIFGTDGIPHKPAPDVVLLAARTVGRAPERGLMVGDTARDLRAGRAAGMKTCGVTWGVTGKDGLAPEYPDWLVDAFDEIYAIATGSVIAS